VCLAAPSRVIEVREGSALTECFGQVREVSLLLLAEEVAVGDYVLIQAGGFAFERVETARAEEALALMAELLARGDAATPDGNAVRGDDARTWGRAA
jgi:hydrogenase expression/formation protein HypC